MTPRILSILAAAPALFLVAAATATTVSLQSIPVALSTNDMSPDGRFIVGETGEFFADGTYILDRSTGVLQRLPQLGLDATAVSDDGNVVLGDIPDPEGVGSNVAAIWTDATGWQSLGALPNALGCPSRSDGYELSADGTVAVGLSWDGCNGRGFRWTEATGMVELEPLANGGNRASVVSADGSVIGGFAQGSFSRTPAIWDGLGNGELLDPPNGDALGEVHGISDDGTILLGEWNGDAFTWRDGSDRETVGAGSLLPGWTGIATDIADNGTVVGFDILQTSRRAWIQPFGVGPIILLEQYIEDNGGTVDYNLEVCQAISADGRTIIGHGFGNDPWIVTISTCDGDIDLSSEVDFADLLAVLAAWGPCGGCPADLDHNGVVDFADILIVLGHWGACP